MRIFISGPCTAEHPRDVLRNVNSAIDAGIKLMELGFAVFIPHLSHYVHLRPQCHFDYEEYLSNDFEWLKVSDAVLRIGGHSAGAEKECNLAKSLSIPVFLQIEALVFYRAQHTNRLSF